MSRISRPFIQLPNGAKTYLVTPSDIPVVKLLGGFTLEGFTYTEGQARRIGKHYGIEIPRVNRKVDTNDLARTGAWKDAARHATRDGLRIMAVISEYLEEGQDPVEFIVSQLRDLDYDVASLGFEEDE